MQSKAATVAEYIASLPDDRRKAISAIRKVFRANIGKGFQEMMLYGLPGFVVPHRLFPAGYHCDPSKPLAFAGYASQKNYISIYLSCIYNNAAEEKWFRDAWAKAGKKLDMGKCSIRFKRIEDVALDVVGEAIRRVSVKDYIAQYQAIDPRLK